MDEILFYTAYLIIALIGYYGLGVGFLLLSANINDLDFYIPLTFIVAESYILKNRKVYK